ncbi:MAG: methylmalonyl-CoA mutase [Chloroflexota bacterium]|nr:MAG: methylmalonyl-CoA mutase [Chloroflexota bacterium]
MSDKHSAKTRILFSADETGHSMGYHVIASALTEAGLEVVLAGPQIPREIAEAAIQEDVDIIAYRIMAAHAPTVVSRLLATLKARGAEDIPIVVGGALLPPEVEQLKAMGISGIFPTGSPLPAVVQYFRDLSMKMPEKVGPPGA